MSLEHQKDLTVILGMYFPFTLTQLVPCSVFSFFRDVSESFLKSTHLFLPCNSSQILHLANNHITIALLQATKSSFAKFYFEFSVAVLVPTVNYHVCESYCVWERVHTGPRMINQSTNTGNVFAPTEPRTKVSFCSWTSVLNQYHRFWSTADLL